MTHIEPITPNTVAAFMVHVTDKERAAIAAIGGAPFILRLANANDHTFAGIVDGVPAFIGGGSVGGFVWMLGNAQIDRAKVFFVRATREQVAIMRGKFGALKTMVDDEHPKSIRWLRAMGFAVGPVTQVGNISAHPVELAA
jgi:hypothetical protein